MNPFASPASVDDANEERPVAEPFRRGYVAAALGVFGAVIGTVVVGIGYMVLVMILDVALTPPLTPMGNYGQFGMVILFSAPAGFVAGASFAMIPYTRFWPWLLAFVLANVFVGLPSVYSDPSDPLHAAAMILCGGIVVAAFFISRIVRTKELEHSLHKEREVK